MVAKDLVRYREVRVADARDDQKSAAQIAAADATSVTQEDYQQLLLSQVKRIIHGDASGTWKSDFLAEGAPSLTGLARRLVDFIDEGPVEAYASGAYKEITGVPWPTDITWYTDISKTKKIVSKVIVRNIDQAPTLITWTLYQPDGVTPLISAVDTITNSGDPEVFEVSRVRTIS